jgi:rhodanese-related sulfurtransferase
LNRRIREKGDVMEPTKLITRMKSGNPPTVVDVRTVFEFRKGHIPGAVHAPTWKILLRMTNIPSDRRAELVLTCELGPRARIAKGLLKASGYRNVVLLEGQMAGWRHAGHPLTK